MKKIMKSILVLVIISVVCTAILTAANFFWKIEETAGVSPELLEKFREMLDDESAEYIELNIENINLEDNILNAYKQTAGNNQNSVIIRSSAPVGAYGVLEMLTALKSDDDSILAVYYYKTNEKARSGLENGLQSFEPFIGLNSTTFDNAEFATVSGATYTANAMISAVKTAIDEYTANKNAIMTAPAISSDILSVAINLERDLSNIEVGDSVKILIEVSSSDTKKANPKNTEFDITLKRNGNVLTAPEIVTEASGESNKAVFSLTINSVKEGEYSLDVKATVGKISVISETFNFKLDNMPLNVITRMFEGTTSVEELSKDNTSGVIIYKNNLNNVVFGIRNQNYEYGVTNIFISFNAEGKIDIIDGEVTRQEPIPDVGNYDLGAYLERFVDKDATIFTGDIADNGIDVITGATYTSNAIENAVNKICVYYVSIEDLGGLGA